MRFETAFFEQVPEGVVISVKVIPQSSVTRMEGVIQDAAGSYALKLRVTAVPEDGKANKLVIKHMAKMLNIPSTSIDMIAGETSRKKTLRICDVSLSLVEKLTALQSV